MMMTFAKEYMSYQSRMWCTKSVLLCKMTCVILKLTNNKATSLWKTAGFFFGKEEPCQEDQIHHASIRAAHGSCLTEVSTVTSTLPCTPPISGAHRRKATVGSGSRKANDISKRIHCAQGVQPREGT